MLPILLAIAFIAILIFVIIAGYPDEFGVSRSRKISAPPETIFPHVNDLHKWEAWNPWGKLDPAMTLTYDGPSAGSGASYSWRGNNKVGEGRMTITESRPHERVRFKLEFFRPMAGTSDAEFLFRPQGNQTEVTWALSGKNCSMAKVFGLFVNCDKMMGRQFEQGLAQLDSEVTAVGKK